MKPGQKPDRKGGCILQGLEQAPSLTVGFLPFVSNQNSSEVPQFCSLAF